MKIILLVSFIWSFTVISSQSEQDSQGNPNCQDGQGNCKRVSERRKKLILKSKKEDNYITLPSDDPERIKIDSLNDWLKRGNVEFPKMDIVFFHKNFRGVVSNRKIFIGSTILFVPITHLITYESSLAGCSVARRMIELTSKINNARHSVVALHLLEEMENPNSFWRPYLDIFPADYNDFPLNFGTLEMSMLQNSSFKDEIIQQKNEYLRDYESIAQGIPEMQLFSYEEFAYARLAVQSRIFGVQIDGQQTQVMVPFADMLNHAKQHTSTWKFNQQRYGFVITAEADIESGLEVFDTYGNKASKTFYLHYGFLEDGNTQQSVTIYVCLSARDRLYKLKQLIFKKMACISFSVTRQTQLKEPLSLSRILAIDSIDDYLAIEKKIGKSQYNKIGPISISNEIKALQMLKQLALKQIEEFGTSIEEDDILLKKETSWSYMNIIKYRKQEKELLQEIANNMDELVLLYTQPYQLNTNTSPEIQEYIKATYDILTQQQL